MCRVPGLVMKGESAFSVTDHNRNTSYEGIKNRGNRWSDQITDGGGREPENGFSLRASHFCLPADAGRRRNT